MYEYTREKKSKKKRKKEKSKRKGKKNIQQRFPRIGSLEAIGLGQNRAFHAYLTTDIWLRITRPIDRISANYLPTRSSLQLKIIKNNG